MTSKFFVVHLGNDDIEWSSAVVRIVFSGTGCSIEPIDDQEDGGMLVTMTPFQLGELAEILGEILRYQKLLPEEQEAWRKQNASLEKAVEREAENGRRIAQADRQWEEREAKKAADDLAERERRLMLHREIVPQLQGFLDGFRKLKDEDLPTIADSRFLEGVYWKNQFGAGYVTFATFLDQMLAAIPEHIGQDPSSWIPEYATAKYWGKRLAFCKEMLDRAHREVEYVKRAQEQR